MERDREVVENTRSRVKIKFKLTNIMKRTQIRGIMVNWVKSTRNLGKFLMISSNLIKSNNESMIEIGENVVFYERGLEDESIESKINEFDFDLAEKLNIEVR